MQNQIQMIDVRILINMIYTLRIKKRGGTLNDVKFVTLIYKKFGQVSTILTSNARNEGDFLVTGHLQNLYINYSSSLLPVSALQNVASSQACSTPTP